MIYVAKKQLEYNYSTFWRHIFMNGYILKHSMKISSDYECAGRVQKMPSIAIQEIFFSKEWLWSTINVCPDSVLTLIPSFIFLMFH